MNGYRFLRPFLFQRDPEEVHERAMTWLHRVSLSAKLCEGLDKVYGFEDRRLQVKVFGQTFASPLGIAAGFDKNGVAVAALRALGFGFVGVGTVAFALLVGPAVQAAVHALGGLGPIANVGDGRGVDEVDSLERARG